MDTAKLQKRNLRILRTVGSNFKGTVGSNFKGTVGSGYIRIVGVSVGLLILGSACSSPLPDTKMHPFTFPKDEAIVGDAKGRPYEKLGVVRSRVDFNSLDPTHEEKTLCSNYFNKAVRDLVKQAKDQGADAVIDVKSIVFYDDGQSKTFATAECSDDGQQGQVLAQGIAVKWKPMPTVHEADVIKKAPTDKDKFTPAP
jgi:hypothetical protein